MKNNKILIITVLTVIILCSLLSGCDEYTPEKIGKMNYAVIESGGCYIIHEVDWRSIDYGTIRIKTKCCCNVIEATTIVLYTKIPNLNGITKCLEME